MEQINFSNKRLVSDTGETKTYLININDTDVRVYESTKTSRFGFNMKDLAKAFNYQTVEEFQTSEQWKEFSSQISENLKKNTGNEEEAQIGKVSDIIGDVPTASTLSAKSAKATSQWVERAGINGALTSPDDVFLYGGGTLDEAVASITPILFRADGSGHVANRNISWDALGNLLVRGIFESNEDGNRIIINPTTRSIKMIDDEDKEVMDISFQKDAEYGYVYPKIVMNGGVSFNKSTIEIVPHQVLVYSGENSSSDKTTLLGQGSMYVWEKDKGFIGLNATNASIRLINYQTGKTLDITPQ